MMTWFRLTLAALTISTAVGCTVHEEVPGPPPPPGPGVVVAPGYYYDADYYDVYGVYHPAFYYYYDGAHYYHRDGIPPGYAFRPRPGFAMPPRAYRPADRPGFGGGGGYGGGRGHDR